MARSIENLITDLENETRGTKREALGKLLIAALRELDAQNETVEKRIDDIVRQRDTGRVDL